MERDHSHFNPVQKALKARGIDNMLRESREDNRENDAEHMRPVSTFLSHLGALMLSFHRSGSIHDH
jgi:hypothetical protein